MRQYTKVVKPKGIYASNTLTVDLFLNRQGQLDNYKKITDDTEEYLSHYVAEEQMCHSFFTGIIQI